MGLRVFAAAAAAVLAAWGLAAPNSRAAEDYEGLPPGVGRDAVYFTCTACHSVKQVVQQRLSRESWDEVLATMVESNGMHPLRPWARTLVINYLATHFGEGEEDWEGLPPGLGREEVFYNCQACHSLMLVKQQGLNREDWDETLTWMIEEQGMAEVSADEHDRIVDYLATYYGRDRAATP